jgi:peptidoglycan/xylan/chitin deacetylase (PgdA/CDA1 family)
MTSRARVLDQGMHRRWSLVALALCAGAQARADDKPAAAPTTATTTAPPTKKQPAGWPSPAAGPSRSGAPEIIFTFDDGPNEPTTKLVLDTLAKHHVHAIFFENGWHYDATPEPARRMLARIVGEGHIIGNHTQDHLQLCSVKDDEKRAYQVDHSHDLLAQLSGLPVLWFRTPFGSHCPRVLALLEERHLDHFHWDIDAQEWKNPDPNRAAKYIIFHIQHLQDRAVILMHDTKIATTRALPLVLDWIDAENARRLANGRQPIRILSGSDLAVERTAPGLVDWMRDSAGGGAGALLDGLAATLP